MSLQDILIVITSALVGFFAGWFARIWKSPENQTDAERNYYVKLYAKNEEIREAREIAAAESLMLRARLEDAEKALTSARSEIAALRKEAENSHLLSSNQTDQGGVNGSDINTN